MIEIKPFVIICKQLLLDNTALSFRYERATNMKQHSIVDIIVFVLIFFNIIILF